MRTRPLTVLFLALASAGARSASAQTTWYVDDDAPGDPGKGTPASSDPLEDGSSVRPFDALSEAIAAAASGDTILVRPSNPEHTGLVYHEFATIDLSGAGAAKSLVIRSTDGPDVTAFQGLTSLPDDVALFRADSGETPAFVFEGFTLRDADNGSAVTDPGGALVIVSSSPTIRDCRFVQNHAYVGGAAYVDGSGSLFEDCAFTENEAAHQGGAIYTDDGTPVFSRCTFVANAADFGGAFLSRTTGGGAPRVLDCVFYENDALVGYAGALAKFDGGSITVERTRFVSNSAATTGGGMHVSGGGEIWDCLFRSNSAGTSGGGLHVIAGGACRVYGSTFTGNAKGGMAETGVTVSELRNSIVWGNLDFEVGVNVAVSYSDVLGGYGGTGNVDADPLFVDPLGLDGMPGTLDDDLSLMEESPCVDAGNALPLAERSPHVGYPLDLAGNPRAVAHDGTSDTGIAALGLAVDLGAFEVQSGRSFARRRTLP